VPPTRRTLLASAGLALTGLTGCTDGSPASPGGSVGTSTPTSTPTPALGDAVSLDGTTVAVADLAAVHSFQYLSAPDAFGVTSADGDQFAFVGCEASGDDPPAASAFAFAVGGERHRPEDFGGFGPVRDLAPVRADAYTADRSSGYLAFRIPAPLAADAAVVLDGADGTAGVRWALPAAALAPLRDPPPSFAVGYDVPDAVDATDPVRVRLDVTNEGDGGGTFRGAINHHGPMHGGDTFALSLDPGASARHELTVDYHVGEDFGGDRLQFAVVTPAGERSFEVRLE
jgi:hypothetical protein